MLAPVIFGGYETICLDETVVFRDFVDFFYQGQLLPDMEGDRGVSSYDENA